MARTAVVKNDQVEVDAAEFGRHVSAGGWRLGLLVARNVLPGQRGHQPSGVRQSSREDLGKQYVVQFAEWAHVSQARVMRYYRAWAIAAEEGVVKAADDLKPGDEPVLPNNEDVPWSHYLTGVQSGKHGADKEENVADPIEAAVRLARQHPSWHPSGGLCTCTASALSDTQSKPPIRQNSPPNER